MSTQTRHFEDMGHPNEPVDEFDGAAEDEEGFEDDDFEDRLYEAETMARGWRRQEALEELKLHGIPSTVLSRKALEGLMCALLSLNGALGATNALRDPEVTGMLGTPEAAGEEPR
jgi:hypothetical protein